MNQYDLEQLTRDREREAAAQRGWRPTKKQAFVGLGVLALIGLAIIFKEPPPLGDMVALMATGSEDDDPPKPAPRRQGKGRFARLRRWWRGSADDDEYENVVVHPDAR